MNSSEAKRGRQYSKSDFESSKIYMFYIICSIIFFYLIFALSVYSSASFLFREATEWLQMLHDEKMRLSEAERS